MLKSIAKNFLATIMILSMALAGIPSVMTLAAEAGETYTDIDDAVTTTSGAAFKIQYEPSNRWHAEAGHSNLFFDGTDHYTENGTNEDYYSMNFTGTGIEIYGSKNVVHANCEVYIDEEKVGEVLSRLDSGEATKHKQLLFSIKNLENGNHTLKVVRKAGEENALQLDKIRVYHEELTATAISLSAETVRLGIGETKRIDVTASPWVIDAPEIEWTSQDEEIAAVNEEGVITATAAGDTIAETTVTATVKGTNVSASVKVIVDPTVQTIMVSVGNEKLLETQNDYEELLNAEVKYTWNGTAWRGDELNSKIVILSKAEKIHDLTVSAADFANEDGDILSVDNISILWLKEIQANDGRNMAGVVNSYPDIIYRGGAAELEKEDVKFAWVNVAIPEDTEPGTYTGKITVNADELAVPIHLTYTVEVLDLVQPEPEATEIQIWQHPFAVANYYLGLGATPTGGISNDLANDFYFTEEHFNLMRATMEEYVSIGGHDLIANIVEEAWNHQSYYSDPSMVKWTKKTDGSWEFDYTWYDAWVEFAIECGVLDPENGIGQIKCYSIVPWDNQIAYYDEASGTTVAESHEPGTDAWEVMWRPFLEDFMQHSKEKGWFEITYISMDERTLNQLEPAVEMIESVTDENEVHFKISSALNYSAPEHYIFTDRIDDISINLGYISDQVQMNNLSEHRRELGLKTTYYSCTGDYPSNYTISDPGDNYWAIWYSMTLGTDGFMRWAWDNYVYDMHGDISYRYWEPGDGWFIYPVERTEVETDFYSTPRFELFKQGIRDVAKAKYLMEQSDELNKQISELLLGMQRPQKGSHNGSAVAANEEQRLLVHSETDRVYTAVTALAREYVVDYINENIGDYILAKRGKIDKYCSSFAAELGEKYGELEAFVDSNLSALNAAATKEAVDLAYSDLKADIERKAAELKEDSGKIEVTEDEVMRIYGVDRYATALKVADALKEELGIEKFETIIVANGRNFADALAGSYLASKKDAPILMTNESVMTKVQEYIKANLRAGGKVYILGGINAVSANFEEGLSGLNVTRLAGATRYETNLMILEEAAVSNADILVCTGKGFADSLSASATGKAILLVGKKLTDAQKDFLTSVKGNRFYVIGGEAAVSISIENEVKAYGSVERLGGATRYETSKIIAEKFFESADYAVLAYGKNYPDGLAGGPLAMSKNAPLVLANGASYSGYQFAVEYMVQEGITSGSVLGGGGLISDNAVREIFAMPAEKEIIER